MASNAGCYIIDGANRIFQSMNQAWINYYIAMTRCLVWLPDIQWMTINMVAHCNIYLPN